MPAHLSEILAAPHVRSSSFSTDMVAQIVVMPACEVSLEEFFDQAFQAYPHYGVEHFGNQAQELSKAMTFAGRRNIDPLLQHLHDCKAGFFLCWKYYFT